MYFIKYPAESVFEHGIFAPFATLAEAERQAANDIYPGNGGVVESIVEADNLVIPNFGDEYLNPPESDYEVVHTLKQIEKLARQKHWDDIKNESKQGEVDRLLELHAAIKTGEGLQAVVPGNAYTVCSGGTSTAGAIALSAATAKTVVGIAAGTVNQPSVVEVAISFDGVTASAVPVLCEWVSGTNATNPPGTNSTSQTPKQLRGWPSQASQATAAYNWTAEPTVLEVFKKRLLTPNGGLIVIQNPLGREPTSIVTASTQFKFVGLRLTAPATVNCHVDLEYEE